MDYKDYKLSFHAKDAAILLLVPEKEAVSCSSYTERVKRSVKRKSTGRHGDYRYPSNLPLLQHNNKQSLPLCKYGESKGK